MVSEVKGAWFVAARAWLDERGALGAIARELDEDARRALLEPLPGHWYPESSLQNSLAAMRTYVAPSREEYVDALDACTVIGISRFFRALLRVASPGFVVRQVPTMWKQIRRGAGHVAVDSANGRARVSYTAFPYFADENYRLLTEGSLRAVVRTCTGKNPRVLISRATDDALDVDIRWSE
ncbi:MAG: hypothetical protein ACXWUG_11715 [Polyangiales bacterium]